MASTLPRVDCVKVSRKRGKNASEEEKRDEADRKDEVAAFLASVRLGSLQRAPRPGDVFRPSRKAPAGCPRPLGLLPNRGYDRESFLPPLSLSLNSVLAAQPTNARSYDDEYDVQRRYDGTGAFRYTERDAHPRRTVSRAQLADGEYEDTLAKCKMQEYVSGDNSVPQKPDASPPSPTQRHRRTKTVPETATKLLQSTHEAMGPMEYLSFINQANLTRKMLYTDLRQAEECQECERCLGRKGRCRRCIAIRVGGGYIILDGGEIPEFGKRNSGTNQYQWDGLGRSKNNRQSQKNNGFGLGYIDGDSGRGFGGDGGGGGGGEGDGRWRGGGGGGGSGAVDGLTGTEGGGGGGGREDGLDSLRNRNKGDGRYTGGGGDDNVLGGRGQGMDDLNRKRGGGSGLWDGDGTESGRQSNMGQRPSSRMSGSSRPGSRFGTRPPSSMKHLGRGGDRRKGVNLEKESGGRGKGGEGEDDGDENSKKNRRRKRGGKEGEEDDENGDRAGFDYNRHGDDDLDAGKSGSLGDLMKFKSKRKDDVKALKATLKELKDIDPLDYLARYCIIDQNKVPHYRRVYDNVDRDEDDEIDILELDFALKAVNFDLISDSELSYINSVLELAGRHKLNFRFFSLIAALSEKVVALDDMVKRLINKMDFEALEVKLKKCKELFYLLADTEHETVEQGGVVTVASLAVELQAGGLTQEHVEYVCNHMNREDRGLVEFLDYLTYVPLFVEIHDNISDNPLDFTRTK